MKNKKILFLAATLLLGAGSLASCGGSRNFTVWGAEKDQAFLTQVVENFKAAYPEYADVKIDVASTEEPEVPNQLKTDLGASADVFHFAGDQLGALVKANYLYAIHSSLTSNIGIEAGVLDAGKVNGTQYGIPFTPNTYFMYYDASVYSATDILSLDAMLAKDVSGAGYQFNLAFDVGNGWYQQSLFFSNGCTIFGAEGNDPTKGVEPANKALESATLIYDMAHNAKIKAAAAGTTGVDSAAGISGTWDSKTIREAIIANGGEYACAPLPKLTIAGQQVEWKSVGDFKHVGVNAITKNPEMACKLATFIANQESQALRYELRQTAPTNSATASDPSIEWDASIVGQTEQLNHTFAQPTIYDQQGFWDASGALFNDLKEARESEIYDFLESFNTTLTSVE